MTWYKDPITLLTMVISASTLAYTIITLLLLRKTSESVQTSKDIFAASHRPYVGIMRISEAKEVSKEWRSGVTILLRNVGAVPARDVKCQLHLLGLEKQPLEPTEAVVLFPEAPIGVTVDFVPPAQMSGVTLLVRIDYKGIRDDEYHTECEANFNPQREDLKLKWVKAT